MRFAIAWILLEVLQTWHIAGLSLPGRHVTYHYDEMVKDLANPDESVAYTALECLWEYMTSSELARYWKKLVALGAPHPHEKVASGVRDLLLERLPSSLLVQEFEHFLKFIKLGSSAEAILARELFFHKMTTDVLTEHASEIVPPLLGEQQLQVWTWELLAHKMSAKQLAWYVNLGWNTIWPRLDGDGHVIWTYPQMMPLLLHQGLRLSRREIMAHCDRFAPLFFLPSALRMESLFSETPATLFAKMRSMSFADSPESRFSDIRANILELLSKLSASCLWNHREHLSSWRDYEGNTWLHVAAAAGHLQACQALVDHSGLSLRAQNNAQEEPLTLAANRAVDGFLRGRISFRQTRFGHGNAYDVMMSDERPVCEVTWHTVPLPGTAGKLGGVHSFLVMVVCEAVQPVTKYVLEKAAATSRAAHQQHGVFIGSEALGTNLLLVNGVRTYRRPLRLSDGSLKTGLKIKDLYNEAHATGSYSLASANCHHLALQVFNYCCAVQTDQEETIPNEWLAKVGALFPQFHGSGSAVSEADIASVNSELPSGNYLVDAPTGFTTNVDALDEAFARTAAALSLDVYKNETARMEQSPTKEAVHLYNRLAQDILVRHHSSKDWHRAENWYRLKTDERIVFEIGEGNRVLVSVFGRWGWPLAMKQPMWSGHVYELTADFRDEVIVHEVITPALNQQAVILHSTQKASTKSPVQWLLARSGDVLYLAFRGTDDPQDLLIDLGAVPDDRRFQDLGLGVHSGIAHSLEQEGDQADNVVNEVIQALDTHRAPGEQLVLCGHSLGGGYAQVMAVHLLSRKVILSAVHTFGAPHVLTPSKAGASQTFRKSLDAITKHWVQQWDPVPRIPLCRNWLVDVLPRLKTEVGFGIRLGIAQKHIQELQKKYQTAHGRLLEKYDVVGQLLLVSRSSSSAFAASDGAQSSKELLCQESPDAIRTLSKLAAFHSMNDYFLSVQTVTEVHAGHGQDQDA